MNTDDGQYLFVLTAQSSDAVCYDV